MSMLHIGFNNYVQITKILGIIDYDTAPIRNIVQAAKQMGLAYDTTKNNKVRSIVICEGAIFLSPISSTVLSERAGKLKNEVQL